MIAALVGAVWLDDRLEGAAVPGWLARLTGEGTVVLPGLVLLFVGVALCPLVSRELVRMFRAAGVNASRSVCAIGGVAGLVSVYLAPLYADPSSAVAILSSVAAVVLFGSLVYHARGGKVRGAGAAAGAAVFTFAYLGLLFGFVFAIRQEYSAWVVLGVLAITKSCDIGAYFTGHAVGRHKLIPWLSPGKTWEGLAGGVVTAAAVGGVCVWLLGVTEHPVGLEWPVWKGVVGGVIFAVTGQVGDLLASLLKRDAGLKDSSSVVPGFGGVLDVVDSVLLVAPVAYWALRLL